MLRYHLRSGLIMAICLTLLIFLLTTDGSRIRAQQETQEVEQVQVEPPTGVTSGASPFDNLAVVLLIDVSGSMEYTDPLRLRETAAGMFVDLLGAEDYLGVVIFDDRAEVVSPLGPVGNPADKEALMAKLSPELEPRGDTDFIVALELAGRQFAETQIGERVPVILLLTDGEPDPYPGSLEDEEFMKEYMETLWEQVDLLAGEGILVYSVGFSEEIDPEVLRRISTDTRGKYFILQEPSELLLAFYSALESLKDRRSFLAEEVDLGSGDTHTFSFEVKEYTRQVNLVLVGEIESDQEELQISVKPPRGEPENIDELLVGGRDNYVTVIVSRPQERHYGSWEVELSGRGVIQALGNQDLYLEALLMEPDPSAQHPLDEPMEIRVEVIARERYADAVFHVEMQVTGPGEPSPIEVPMTPDGNSFRGIYEFVDRQGEYELSWQVLLDGETIISNSALITVSRLPSITTDFWADREGFRLGDQIVVSASLTTSGERMQEGPHLQVDNFTLHLEYRDGARLELELYDSGDREHGNSRAGDGIWSNRLSFNREGPTEALMTASGTYRNANFVLKKRFGFSVSPTGSIAVRLIPEELWSQPGGILTLPLEVTSQSPFTQTLRLETDDRRVQLLQDRVVIPPGEDMTVMLAIEIGETVAIGSQLVSLGLTAEDGMTAVLPEELSFEFDNLTPSAAFLKRFSGLTLGVGIAVTAGLIFIIALFGGGSLLNRFYLLPRLIIKGYLLYRDENFDPYTGEGRTVELKLGEARKKEIVIAFDSGNPQADFNLSGGASGYDMIISNNWNDHLPGFWRGWKAFLKRQLTVETLLRCTPPGILMVDGKAYSRIELQHDDKFESGGFIFNYRGKLDKGAQQSNRGVNILDGKL